MTTFVLTGLPGTGKTRLALALAAHIARTREARVVHTDVLKALLRDLVPGFPPGPGWAAPAAMAAHVHPLLAAQAAKARKEGVALVVEGTLAGGFVPEDGVVVRLVVPEEVRVARVAGKPGPAREGLEGADLGAYGAWLDGVQPPRAVVLDASLPVEDLVTCLLSPPSSPTNPPRGPAQPG